LLHTAGNYSKTNASLYHIQRLNNRLDLHASVTGQYAWKNLDSSEDFYVGGPDGVRAFPQGELGGDSGILGTLELRYRTGLPELQLTAFVDGARVEYDHDQMAGDTSDNIRNIFGVGLGLIYSKNRDWFAKFDWATPLGNHASTSEGENVHNAWWFRLVKQF
jgi:hemolysin activation/secretion protein